ncbi:vesicle coat protein [Lithospermum erythrorhizon]|uniref:Vesicle coat protein n=1 Tax=Lithospermum erythrorhizon TaxID=34254 RepID=A0AAV3R6E3_LITER
MVADLCCKLKAALRLMRDQTCIAKAFISTNKKNYINNGGFSKIEIALLRATAHGNNSNDNVDSDNNNYKLENEILFLVSDNPGSVIFLAERLTCRLAKTKDLRVALKTLVLVHRLLRGGSRGFEQHLRAAYLSGHLQISLNQNIKRSNRLLQFLNNYAAHLEERLDWYINQSGKLEPVVVEVIQQKLHHLHQFDGGNDNNNYTDRESERRMESLVMRILKYLHFLDSIMNCSPFDLVLADKNNKGLAIAALRSTLKESFQVYMSLWDSVVTLMNMFFDLPKGARELACDVLKRAAKQSQELCNFYINCRGVIEEHHNYQSNNRQFVLNYPSIDIITMDHLMAMEQLNSADDSVPPFFTFSRPSYLSSFSSSSLIHEGCGDENSSLQPSLFSCKLETKVSKVWVVFDD